MDFSISPFHRYYPLIDFSGDKVKPIKKSNLLKQDLVTLKGGACERCGQIYPSQVYDFHHRDPVQKKFQLSSHELKNRTWEDILLEADKTNLLCATCHRLVHISKEKEWFDKAYWPILEMDHPDEYVSSIRKQQDIHVKGVKPNHYNRGNHKWSSSKFSGDSSNTLYMEG